MSAYDGKARLSKGLCPHPDHRRLIDPGDGCGYCPDCDCWWQTHSPGGRVWLRVTVSDGADFGGFSFPASLARNTAGLARSVIPHFLALARDELHHQAERVAV